MSKYFTILYKLFEFIYIQSIDEFLFSTWNDLLNLTSVTADLHNCTNNFWYINSNQTDIAITGSSSSDVVWSKSTLWFTRIYIYSKKMYMRIFWIVFKVVVWLNVIVYVQKWINVLVPITNNIIAYYTCKLMSYEIMWRPWF